MVDQHDISAQLKAKNPIEDVIIEGGIPLKEHGTYKLRAPGSGGLEINKQTQLYFWFKKEEGGDVFTWLEKEKGLGFKEACRFLAKRCGMPDPVFSHENAEIRNEARKKEDTFETAAAIFERWLWDDPVALAYARSRGWSDETIHAAHLGYSGNFNVHSRIELFTEFKDQLKNANADYEGVAAAALTGLNGDVQGWASEHEIHFDEKYLKNKYVPGFLGEDALVYPHFDSGKIVYYSARLLHPNPKDPENKSRNLVKELAGPKRPYFSTNWKDPHINYRIVCEGPADAITISHEWKIPAVALCGVNADPETFKNTKNWVFYLALDADKTGEEKLFKVAETIGPMCRLFSWKTGSFPTFLDAEGKPQPVKDANNLLITMNQANETKDGQIQFIEGLIKHARTYVEAAATLAGEREGAEQELEQKKTIALMLKMNPADLSMKKSILAKSMKMQKRDLDGVLNTFRKMEKNVSTEDSPEETYGGFIHGYVVEYLWDPETKRASLAWRDPEGVVRTGDQVEIEGKWYAAVQDDVNALNGGVLFPSALDPQLHPTREIATYVEQYVRSVFLLPSESDAKIISYYILLTWMYDCFYAIPYLRAMGEAEAGKSELMKRIALICYRRILDNGCSTTASLFRLVDQYKGTVYMDEMDLKYSDASVDKIKFLNVGYTSDGKINRVEEYTDENGNKKYRSTYYQAFCPKLLTMHEEFEDLAVGTRCITFMVHPRGTKELDLIDVSLEMNKEMKAKALILRNKLLRWRLEHWEEDITVGKEYHDYDISTRLNQVTGPMLIIAKDNQEMQAEIKVYLRGYNQELVLSRTMTPLAKIIEAMWKIMKYPDLHAEMVMTDPKTNGEKIKIGYIAKIANQLIDMENMVSDDSTDKPTKKKNSAMTAKSVGQVIHHELQLPVDRTKIGYCVHWNQARMEDAAKRYGVNPDEFVENTDLQPKLVTESAAKVQAQIDEDNAVKQEELL